MGKFNNINQLKKYISNVYDHTDVGGVSSDTYSEYENGQQNGKTWTLFRIGTLIGLELEMPNEVEGM